jgi:hypothetical protein
VRQLKSVSVTLALALVALLPRSSAAQTTASTIAGVVKDTSGAALAGVTVEAESPALIEKVRAVVTDGEGQYKIIDLRPGDYTIKFTLQGFNTYKRDGVEVPPRTTVTVSGTMSVGNMEETVTVSGAAPMVDVQANRDVKVLSEEVLEALPTVRSPTAYTPLVPGVNGGLGTVARDSGNLTIHGSNSLASNVAINGFENNSMAGSGGIGFTHNVNQGYVEQITVEIGAQSAEMQKSGILTNIIPRTGSNRFTSAFYAGYANSNLQSGNLTDELRKSGLTAVNSLDELWDYNASWGGPIIRDKVWFYNSNRYWGSSNYVAGMYYNATPTAWTYTPDRSRQATNRVTDGSASIRLTYQANPKMKFGAFYDAQPHCTCNRLNGAGQTNALVSPEATQHGKFWGNHFAQANWDYARSSRLLLQAGVSSTFGEWIALPQAEVAPGTIAVTEQSTGILYRASDGYSENPTNPVISRFSATYVTGSHEAKAGVSFTRGRYINAGYTNGNMTYRFNNGIPNQVTLFASPAVLVNNMNADLGLYIQDRWTVRRLTLNVGLRYDYFNGSVPEQNQAELLDEYGLPAPAFAPVKTYAAVKNVPNWNDVSPRLAGSFDLFGDGTTALKGSLGRYVDGQTIGIATANNPINTSVNSATRTWGDSNTNFVVDCDLKNNAQNGECGPISNVNFGKANPNATRYADDVTHGNRGYNWEVELGAQRQVMKGFALSGTYYRRWSGNFTLTQNTATTPLDYSSYCITTPMDARLPDGGGQRLCGFYDVNPNKFGQVANLITQTSNFGKQQAVYDGYAITADIRMSGKLTIQGGLDSGRTRTNNCYVLDKPNLSGLGGSSNTEPFCNVQPPFLTQVKFLGVYQLPWWGLQASAAYQNVPGPQITASYVATNAEIAPSLGRNLSSGVNGNATLQIVAPGTSYGARAQELDVSVRKIFNVRGGRFSGVVDMFNVLNRSDVLSYNLTYGPSWLRPTSILTGRWFKLGVQVDFK